MDSIGEPYIDSFIDVIGDKSFGVLMSMKQLISGNMVKKRVVKWKKVRNPVAFSTMNSWCTWKERNQCIFDGKALSCQEFKLYPSAS